jgi:hypothetical protein
MEKELRREEGELGGEDRPSMWLAVSFRCRALTTSLTVLDEVRGEDAPCRM